MGPADQVDYVRGATRLFGIIGDPITQVRSPEMVTWEIVSRGADGILVPFHVLPGDFEATTRALMRMPNLDGLIFTIPYKAAAAALADRLGPNARTTGVINALGRDPQGGWRGEVFDGLGCVEAFRRHGHSFAGKRVGLIGAGGAGTAIGVAIAHEGPAAITLTDLDLARAQALAGKIASVNPRIAVTIAVPNPTACDMLLNASPTGMLGDARLPLPIDRLPPDLIVFDAIVMPEETPLLKRAAASGCRTIKGREMMRGQIARIVDYFGLPQRA